MRVLIVDDEPDVIESVQLGPTLQWREVEVLSAHDGDAALDRVEKDTPDVVLLDNMDTATLVKAVAIAGGRVVLEASGGITVDSIATIAATGVDYASSGAITHSAPSLDVALDIDL